MDVQAASKDKALGLLAAHHVDFDPNSVEAKRVLRKIDMRVMPLIFTVYLLQLMVIAPEVWNRDKTNMNDYLGQEQFIFCRNYGHSERCQSHS